MLLFIVALLLIIGGMAGLALGMARHFQEIFGRPPLGRVLYLWRGVGYLLLMLALLPCIAGWGVAIGIVLWSGLLAAGVMLVALFLMR